MQGALVILAFTIIAGILLYVLDITYYRKRRSTPPTPQSQNTEASASSDNVESTSKAVANTPAPVADGECCGMHAVCEKKAKAALEEPVYYDDEELDRFKGRTADSYTSDEIEEWREVMITLLPSDAAGWAQSIEQRGLLLPEELHDELLMIIAEAASPN